MPLRMLYELVGRLFPDDPRLAWRLYEYFPRYRHAWGELKNQWNRLAGRTTVYRLQGLIIEPSSSCNLKCTHCTPQNNPLLKRGMMSMELYESILEQTPHLAALVLTWNGEPLLHPRIADMVRLARKRNIHVCMFTNATLLDEEKRASLVAAGLSELIVSMEAVGLGYTQIRGHDYNQVAENLEAFLKLRMDVGSSVRVRLNVTRVAGFEDAALEVEKVWGERVDFINFEPHMAVTRQVRRSACKTLFRSATIGWDGTVSPCCVDMDQSLRFGRFETGQSLLEIVNGAAAQSVRERHINGDYPEICAHCPGFYG